jgi:hypothetical protein
MLIDLAQEGSDARIKSLSNITWTIEGWQGFSACHDTAAKLSTDFKQGEINVEQTATRAMGRVFRYGIGIV